MAQSVNLADIQRVINNTPCKRWEFIVPTPDGKAVRGLCDANTKSEVRSALKKALPGGKVPAGTVIRETPFKPRQALFDKTVQALAEQIATEVQQRVDSDNPADVEAATSSDGETVSGDIQCPDSVGVAEAASASV
jgi:hypothetical protein